MKPVKILAIAMLAMFTYGAANAQTHHKKHHKMHKKQHHKKHHDQK